MALSRRTGQRFQAAIWPGFVDAMTGLLLVLMFVLTIFMVVQFVLRETISGQEDELDTLSAEISALAFALGLEERKTAQLETRLGALSTTLDTTKGALAQAEATVAALTRERDAGRAALEAAQVQITSFEAQVAALLSERDTALGTVAQLQDEQAKLLSEQEALNLALAQSRTEIDAQTEAARLAAAKREALEALIADLKGAEADAQAQISDLQGSIDTAEAERLAEAAAAEALRERLKSADTELTAMTLALEAQRKKAEETLTLLAAAEAAKNEIEGQVDLLAVARQKLAEQEEISLQAQREAVLLNQQLAALRGQLGDLQALLDDAKSRDAAAKVQLESLGSDLNAALARAAAEERRRRQLEEAERKRLEAEAQDLERYRSEFFGRLRDVLGNQAGVRIEGDRFVFSSEVLFDTGQATLSVEGQAEIAKVARILQSIAGDIPPELNWIIRVDGHTDNIPVSGSGAFADNWELSQARALSVVRYMIGSLGIPGSRLAANGFGEYQPVNPANTPAARAQNRRIELKLTER